MGVSWLIFFKNMKNLGKPAPLLMTRTNRTPKSAPFIFAFFVKQVLKFYAESADYGGHNLGVAWDL